MQKNIDKCISLACNVSNSIKADIKLYQMLIGSLNFCSFYTFYGRFHLKVLNRFHGYFSKGFRIVPPSFKSALKVWEQSCMYEEINIPKSQIDVELFTDASNSGWGGALVEGDGIHAINGTWTPSESSLHINLKELLSCIYSIKHFATNLKNKVVLIHIDSKVTNCWIRKRGSIKNRLAHEFIWDLLNILEQHNIEIQTKWIEGKSNIIADSLSRDFGDIHQLERIASSLCFSPHVSYFTK